jgi:hypothetical protein
MKAAGPAWARGQVMQIPDMFYGVEKTTLPEKTLYGIVV